MSLISIERFISGVISIVNEKPSYKVGHDGSNGCCDGMGLLRGGLLRGGATKITCMKEPNQFARRTAVNLHKLSDGFSRGDILLKTRDASDSSMPLPSKYRRGGSDYTGDDNNYVDVGVAINNSDVLFMTKDGVVKSINKSDWDYVCEVPYVSYEKKPLKESSFVFNANGAFVKMFAKASFACDDVIDIPNKSNVVVNEISNNWASVTYGEKSGFVLSHFVKPVKERKQVTFEQTDWVELEKAYRIIGKILGYIQ